MHRYLNCVTFQSTAVKPGYYSRNTCNTICCRIDVLYLGRSHPYSVLDLRAPISVMPHVTNASACFPRDSLGKEFCCVGKEFCRLNISNSAIKPCPGLYRSCIDLPRAAFCIAARGSFHSEPQELQGKIRRVS